jgi:hypothetical protein
MPFILAIKAVTQRYSMGAEDVTSLRRRTALVEEYRKIYNAIK